jgi:hypothetical protein
MSSSHIPVHQRVQASRNRRRAAGLKRVEVFVPDDKVDLLKAYVAQLRNGSQAEAKDRLRKLIAKAYAQYRALYLDNIGINPASADFADAAIVAAALMHRGNAAAYKLGKEISNLVK